MAGVQTTDVSLVPSNHVQLRKKERERGLLLFSPCRHTVRSVHHGGRQRRISYSILGKMLIVFSQVLQKAPILTS